MGRLKGEIRESYHLTQVADTIYSGIEVIKWVVLLMVALVKKCINKGYMFQDE